MSNEKAVAGDPEMYIKTNKESKLSNTVISMLALSQLDGFYIKYLEKVFLIKIKMAIHHLKK